MPHAIRGQSVEQEESEAVQDPPGAATESKPVDTSRAASLIVRKTNEFRQEQGRPEVDVDPELAETARYFAGYMARTDKYGHTADGKRPSGRAEEHGYEYCIVSENIAYQFDSTGFTVEALAEGFVEGWENSPGHRKNMLDPDVTETGVAVARSDETGYYYAVQMFGRPESEAIEFQVVNHSGAEIRYQIGDRTVPLPPRVSRTHRQCRPSELTFRLPGGEGESKTVRPGPGDRFLIVKD